MLPHLHCVQFVQEQNQRKQRVPKLRTPPKQHHHRMWKHSKSQSTTVRHDTWARLSLFYQLCWLYFVYCLPFICIITMEVVSSNSCIGINIIKNRQMLRDQWPVRNPFQLFHQLIHHLHLMHRYRHHVKNVCHKRLAKLLHSIQALSAVIPDKAVINGLQPFTNFF